MNHPKRDWCGGPAGALIGLAVLLFFVALAFGCGTPPAQPEASEPPATTQRTIIEIHAVLPDLPIEHAVRVEAPTTVTVEQAAAFNPIAYVDGLAYGWTVMAPAMEAFRVVALVRGWSQAAIDRWTPFVFDVIVKESGGCPNAVGGDVFVVGTCSEYQVRGDHEDSGFGQATTALYGRSAILCVAEGICSQLQIISDPWTSMVALVATLERIGRYPWCDYEGAPAYHDCGLIGRTERPL